MKKKVPISPRRQPRQQVVLRPVRLPRSRKIKRIVVTVLLSRCHRTSNVTIAMTLLFNPFSRCAILINHMNETRTGLVLNRQHLAIDQTLRLPMVVDRTPITGPCNRTLTRLDYVLHQMDSVPVLLVPLVPVSIANKRAITRPIAPKTKLVSIANKRAITRPIAPKKRSPTTPTTPPTTLKNTETTTVAHCKEPTW